ncbi:5'-nucleotidase, lipoprotein e(P4) family [Fusobacterium russii]|uniref:5'-nucleotidase, lipoprotein e(P4) family n=1 Tax=Fusobacterium russii TaxID=854 RepID=UPI0003A917EA|nr:5'-nucleotidase, lipoprotein e(P4) family [Fusobacterium russii]
MKKIFLCLSLLTAVACTNMKEVKQEDKISLTYEVLRSEQNVMSTNWFQTSGEAKALFIQGYNIATQKLKEHLKKPSAKPYSIVLDLDETVLDNSAYSAENIKKGQNWSKESWNEWVNMVAADVLPGAKDFLEFANKNKVEIYYISDRYEEHLDATIENLKKLGLPVQSRAHVLLKEKNDKSGKVNRRDYVKNHTNLIMLFGDNLSDFEEFSKKSIEDRNKKVEELSKEFGDKFIVFPNPMYGAFETAIYGGKFGDARSLINARKAVLKAYEDINK